MSAPVATRTQWPWPADVLAFAAKEQVDACLDPLLEATQQMFPTARSLEVYLAKDPEIRDYWQIVFHPKVPRQDVPDFVKAVHSWTDELYRYCPAPSVCTFCFLLEVVS